MLAKPTRHDLPAAARNDAPAAHGHADRGHGDHVHHHGHDHSHSHAHDHHHAPKTARSRQLRSLMALSGGQRLALVAPLIAMLWALAFWAMRGTP